MAKKKQFVTAAAAFAVAASAVAPAITADAATKTVRLSSDYVRVGDLDATLDKTYNGGEIHWYKSSVDLNKLGVFQTAKGFVKGQGIRVEKRVRVLNHAQEIKPTSEFVFEQGVPVSGIRVQPVLFADGNEYAKPLSVAGFSTDEVGEFEGTLTYANRAYGVVTKTVKYKVIKSTPEVEEVKPVDVNKMEVKFNGKVDSEKATFKLKRGAVVYPVTVKWNEDKSVATLSTAMELPKGTYTVEVGGLTEEMISKEVEVMEETVSSLEISSDSVQIADGNVIRYKVLNQYGTDMEVDSDTAGLAFAGYNVTDKSSVTLNTVANESQIEFSDLDGDGAEVGDVVRVTLTYKGLTAQKNVVVTENAAAGDFEFGEVVIPENQKRIYVGDTNVQIKYSLFDQFGKEIELTPNSTGAGAISTADGVTFTSSNLDVVDPADIDTDAEGNLIFEAGDEEGTATLTAIINATGDVATVKVTVAADPAVDRFDVVAPSSLVVQGEAMKVKYVAADQYGTAYDLEDFGTAEQSQLTFVSSDTSVVDASANGDISFNDDNELVVTPHGNGDVKISVKIGTKTVATLDLDVQPTAVAQQITAASFPTVFEVGSSLTLDNDDLTVVDQYGREFEGPISVSSDTDAVIQDNDNNTIVADAAGTAKLTITVGTKTLDVNVKVINSADIKSYTLESFGTIYAGNTDAYDVTAMLNGVDAEGKKVVLADTAPDFITSSNTSVAKVDNDVEVRGLKEGTATITAWKDGVKVASASVVVSEEAPYAKSVEFSATSIDDAVSADVKSIVDVLDQYGVEITNSTSMYFFGGNEIDSDGNVTDDDDSIDVVETITVVTGNGLSKTADITIN
ncbi:hypothetical protein [Exiguobacterium qingdaonense]|uniref:hypothetical protein n=1 Tax=Exiguobacterium qingdaonense TaxID=2751251 RepID=UPI001BEA9888|nr:hypothetical protein [Exiguobacterium qingdaonense]